ncbi:MAG: hypothetical protein DDT34_01824 [Firmicutes bacterium]|nr:hypothetical protein [Bacillota bacterium]
MNEAKSRSIVVVTGDVTMDWNIARVPRAGSISHVWTTDEFTRAFCQRGGAAMLADLIEAMADNLRQSKQADFEVRQTDAPRCPVTPDDDRFHQSYAIWAPFTLDERQSNQKEEVWRVQQFLGLYRAHSDSLDDWKKVVDDPVDPELVILDDAGLEFRDHPAYWPTALSTNTPKPWILLKMAAPVAEGKLWNHLRKNHADKLVVVMTVNDLRRSQVQISRQVSWERTAQDLAWELLYNPNVNGLTQCAHVIVSFDTVGAILLSRQSEATLNAFLLFDPNVMEGEWGRHHKGYMIGHTSCLMAGIARELMVNATNPAISRGIQTGIAAMRFLYMGGYGRVGKDPKQICLAFPASNIAVKLAEDRDCLAVTPIRNPAEPLSAEAAAGVPEQAPQFWTIIEDQKSDSLENIAQQIVRKGLEHALFGVPIGRFGKLATVDRREIEALRSISSLIREYCEGYQKNPLSIAIFGPPGAGKSFVAKQVADSACPGEIQVLVFNLSQFGGPEDLVDAFHQVRDRALSGKMPLVFWDEFDVALEHQPLGWLRYFLSPMEDGEFQEGQLTHPIGRSIFVFAGGTSRSMEHFGADLGEDKHRAMKLPDFVSRLKGFINVVGPNRQESENVPGRTEDPYYVIRRAILLRSIFTRYTPQLLRNDAGINQASIDQGVLRAFLLTREYKHGARSMESIVAMSQLADKTSFERSSLPSEAQLNLHVDGRDFSALVHRIELDKDLVEKLAEAAHKVFCAHLRAEGYRYGPVTDEDKKEHSSLKDYAELPEDEKEQNRNNVRDIANKLSSVGYAMVPLRSNETPGEFSSSEVEKLAEMEHERWMRQKLDAGWKYGEETDKPRRLHQCLVPWNQLPPKDVAKDRALVTAIPKILARAGYTVVKLDQKKR